MRKPGIVVISDTVEELTSECVVGLTREFLGLDMVFHREKK
jgi:hypothetical protein